MTKLGTPTRYGIVTTHDEGRPCECCHGAGEYSAHSYCGSGDGLAYRCAACAGTGYELCSLCRERPGVWQDDLDSYACDECTLKSLDAAIEELKSELTGSRCSSGCGWCGRCS